MADVTTMERPGMKESGVRRTANRKMVSAPTGEEAISKQSPTFDDHHPDDGTSQSGVKCLLFGCTLRSLHRRDFPLLDVGAPELLSYQMRWPKSALTLLQEHRSSLPFPLDLTVASYTSSLLFPNSLLSAHSSNIDTCPSTSTMVV